MAKVINVVCLDERNEKGEELFQVKTLKNNLVVKINQIINEEEVRQFINTGFEVNIKELPVSKE